MNTKEYPTTGHPLEQLRENLDGLHEDDLFDVIKATKGQSVRQCASIVFPDTPRDHVAAYRQLLTYAELKEQAMRWRRIGKIQSALQNENQCDRIYNRLPGFAKFF